MRSQHRRLLVRVIGLAALGALACRWPAMRLREAAQDNSRGRLAARVAVGLESACVTTRDADVVCFGRGYGRTFEPSDALHESREVVLSARDCAIVADATVSCWGGVLAEWWWSSSQVRPPWPPRIGRLPNPALSAYGFGAMLPVPGVEHARRWSDRGDGGCAVSESGDVQCVGYGLAPEIGSDAWRDATKLALPSTKDIALGEHHGCALGVDGRVRCWGLDEGAPRAPGKDVGLDRVAAIGAGARFACALREDGTVWCWGDSPHGALGLGDVRHADAPRALSLVDVVDLAVGPNHACAVTRAQRVACWGNDGAGQLGDGAQIDQSIPVLVSDVVGAVQVAVGASASCAVTNDGELWCWGIFDRSDGPWRKPVRIAL